MAATGPPPSLSGPWTRPAIAIDDWLLYHKTVVSATTASLISTFAGFPLDSLKSRLQSSRESISIPRLAAEVIKEEGIGGLWRGFPLPLFTISIVRTISFTIYSSTKRILNSSREAPEGQAAQHTKSDSRWVNLKLGWFAGDNARDVAVTSLLAGAVSGGAVCLGSAPFELVKVRRQLEYQIYRDSHPQAFPPAESNTSRLPPPNISLSQHPAGSSIAPPPGTLPTTVATARPPPFTPPTTIQAVRMIVKASGPMGLWTGFRLHFIRDTMGTALYFAEYDVMRHWLGRKKAVGGGSETRDGQGYVQGDLPEWARYWLPTSLVPFVCGSLAGVTSWALIYPVDAIKTKAQQRALSGLEPRTPMVQLLRLVRGTDKNNPKPFFTGVARLYRGLGVSMIRSMLTHGLLWTFVDWASYWIDRRPVEMFLDKSTALK